MKPIFRSFYNKIQKSERVYEMNLPQIFNYHGKEVRTVIVNNEPWWVAKDVCEVLELGDASKAVARLDDDEKGTISIPTLGGNQMLLCINEPGLYSLVAGSRKPEAKPFKRWVNHEVLPSIRKTGSYSVEQYKIPQSYTEALRLAADLSEENERVKLDNERLALQTAEDQKRLREQETPVAIYNLAMTAKNAMTMQEVAKALGTGRTKLYQILREENVIMKDSTLPYQRYLDNGYFKVTQRPRTSGDTTVNDPATRVYPKGFDFIARLLQKRAQQVSA